MCPEDDRWVLQGTIQVFITLTLIQQRVHSLSVI